MKNKSYKIELFFWLTTLYNELKKVCTYTLYNMLYIIWYIIKETIVLSFCYILILILLFTPQCISISRGCKSMWTTSRCWHTTSGLRTECPSWPTTLHPSGSCTPTAWPGRTSNRRSIKLSPWKPTEVSWCWVSLLTAGPGRWTRTVVSPARHPSLPTVPEKRARILRPKVYWPTTRFALTWSRALRPLHLSPFTGT